jgi:tRNA-dihydrouridine synthase
LTIKLRSGWDPSGDQALKAASMAEDCGANAVAIHPRTALQGFSGRADWSLIGRIKGAVSIPVIGNGDVCVPDQVIQMREQTGCDAVMIGRAAIGNPWIFSQALDSIHGRPFQMPDLSARLQVTLRYIESSVRHFGEFRAVRMMRSRLAWFVKGLPRASGFRSAIVRLQSRQEMTDAVCAYFEELKTATTV